MDSIFSYLMMDVILCMLFSMFISGDMVVVV